MATRSHDIGPEMRKSQRINLMCKKQIDHDILLAGGGSVRSKFFKTSFFLCNAHISNVNV